MIQQDWYPILLTFVILTPMFFILAYKVSAAIAEDKEAHLRKIIREEVQK